MKQREIKFRAWDRNYRNRKDEVVGHMFYSNDYGLGLGAFFALVKENKREVMEYTGLKDKKRTREYLEGQEIYEGDIVQAEDYVGFKNLTAEVIYNRSRFCLNTGTIPEELIPELCKVIGDIHSNPELLK